MTTGHDSFVKRQREQFKVDRLARAINDLDSSAEQAVSISGLTESSVRTPATGSVPNHGRLTVLPASASQASIHGGAGALILPPDELVADNPVDLARLLARCMAAAGLTAGQIAAKTGIPRSQTYYLIDPKRNSLPRKEVQVQAFLVACRLHSRQIEFVLSRWRRLDADRGRYKAATTVSTDQPVATAPTDASGALSRAMVATTSPPGSRLRGPGASRRSSAPPRLHTPEVLATSRRGLAGSVVVVLLGGIALVVDPTAATSVITTAMATAIVVGKILRLKEWLSFALRVWVLQAATPGRERSSSR